MTAQACLSFFMFTDATNTLIKAVREAATDADRQASAQSFFDVIQGASREEANVALGTLSAQLDLEDPARGGFLALVCGSLVEGGCDPQILAAPLIKRLGLLLQASVELVDACTAKMPQTENEDEDPNEVFERIREQLAPQMPQQNAAWGALDQFWPPAIAVFSFSPQSRASARHLKDLAARISYRHDGGHWLKLMLAVLDNEPIIAIEPQTKLGVVGRISGVALNFQLNVLLMDSFPKSGFWRRRRVPRPVADTARGLGPQETRHTVSGVWNLYTWEAIQPGLTLPDPGAQGASQNWVWNEGTPADIPVFEGHRVVLLGPPSYQRTWSSQRMFNHLPADLAIERKLTQDEVKQWLERMLAAKDRSKGAQDR